MMKKSMRTSLITVAILATASVSFNASATNACRGKTGCEAKVCQIEQKIEYAKQYNNAGQLANLQNALDRVNAYCTTDSVKDELLDKIEDAKEDIQDTRDDIAEIREDLDEAIDDGRQSKIAKYEAKIVKKQAKLMKREDKLAKLEAELSQLD